MSESSEFVIVHRGTSLGEAEVILTLLKDSGVAAFVPDSNTPFPGVDITPFGEPGGAGCDVLVPRAELERAQEVIAQARRAGEEDASSDT
jgi:hypothetical protein